MLCLTKCHIRGPAPTEHSRWLPEHSRIPFANRLRLAAVSCIESSEVAFAKKSGLSGFPFSWPSAVRRCTSDADRTESAWLWSPGSDAVQSLDRAVVAPKKCRSAHLVCTTMADFEHSRLVECMVLSIFLGHLVVLDSVSIYHPPGIFACSLHAHTQF